MWRGALQYVDNFSARLMGTGVLRAVVAFAEKMAQGHPVVYNIGFAIYSLLGYLFIFGFVAFLFSLPGLLMISGLTLVLLIFVHDGPRLFQSMFSDYFPLSRPEMYLHFLRIVLQSLAFLLIGLLMLFLRLFQARAPGGLLLLRSEAPALFESVDNAAARQGTTIDRVMLTNQFNCAVIAMPQLIGERRILYVGYPCLSCLSVVQFEAILAHEAAHLTMRHSRTSNLINQQRRSWLATVARMRKRFPLFYIPFNFCFFWYTPVFGALAFAHAKQQEFNADDRAKQFTSESTYAKALLSFSLKHLLFDKAFQQELGNGQGDVSQGPKFFEKASAACARPSHDDLKSAWETYLKRKDEDLTVSHPCLMRRLQRLEFAPIAGVEDWMPDWAEVLDEESPRALELLGAYATRVEEKMSAAFTDSKLSHDVSRDHAYMVRGVAHLKARRLTEAVSDFSEALKLDPTSVSGYISRSTAYIEQKEYQKSLEDCSKAIALQPGNSGGFANRACTYLLLQQYDEAIRDATVAIELAPTKTENYIFRSRALIQLKRMDEAIKDYSSLIALKKSEPSYYTQRAVLYAEVGDYDLALLDIDAWERIWPGNRGALNARSNIYMKMKRFDLSVAALDKMVALDPNDVTALLGRAAMLGELGECERGRADFDRSLALMPKDAAPTKSLVLVACLVKDWSQAVSIAETLIAQGDRDSMLLANYARALIEFGRNDEALVLINEALSKVEHHRLFATRARILHALKEHQLALPDINRAIEKEPIARFYLVRASIYEALGRDADAESDRQAAKEKELAAVPA